MPLRYFLTATEWISLRSRNRPCGTNSIPSMVAAPSQEKPRISLAESSVRLGKAEAALEELPEGDVRRAFTGGVDADWCARSTSRIGFPRIDRRFSKVLFGKPSFQGVNFRGVREFSLEFARRSRAETTILAFLARGARASMRNADRF